MIQHRKYGIRIYLKMNRRSYKYYLYRRRKNADAEKNAENSANVSTLRRISRLIGYLQCCKGSESLSKLEEDNFYAAAESLLMCAHIRILAIGETKQDFRLTTNDDGSATLTRRKVIYQPSPIINRFQGARVIPNIQRFGKSQ